MSLHYHVKHKFSKITKITITHMQKIILWNNFHY